MSFGITDLAWLAPNNEECGADNHNIIVPIQFLMLRLLDLYSSLKFEVFLMGH